MGERKYFGTDGIRGCVGDYPITADFALRLGRAAGLVLGTSPSRTLIVGKDTRLSGYMFESALEAGLAAAGANIKLVGPMPTPAIAYLTRTMRACAGIVISASHNAYADNGFKFFNGAGEKLPDDVELAIESRIDEPFTTVASDLLGRAQRVDDARGRYIEFVKSTVREETILDGLNIVLDCAHGAGYQVGPQVFQEMGAQVHLIGARPDGFNINQECGSTHLDLLRQAVHEQGADLGIALDGDGDRVLMVDHQGHTVDGDQLIFVIANKLRELGQLQGGVVGTLMSNFGLERAFAKSGIEFCRAGVGDRYVHAELKRRGWFLGGEASGHVLDLRRATTGDGLVTALAICEAIIDSGRSLADLVAGMQKVPQILINVRCDKPVDLDHPALQAGVAQAEASLGNEGRVLLRASGTEPLIRVMAEGLDEARVRAAASELAEQVRALA